MDFIKVKAKELKEFSESDFDWGNIDLYELDGLFNSIVPQCVDDDGIFDDRKCIYLIPNHLMYKICKLQFIKIFDENDCYDFFGDNSEDMLIDGYHLENVLNKYARSYDLHNMHCSLESLCDIVKGFI